MRYPTEEEIRNLREHYPAGARVELLEMQDEQAHRSEPREPSAMWMTSAASELTGTITAA